MDVLVCEKCGEFVLPFVKSKKIRKWTATSYVVEGYECPRCGNATFYRKTVKVVKE